MGSEVGGDYYMAGIYRAVQKTSARLRELSGEFTQPSRRFLDISVLKLPVHSNKPETFQECANAKVIAKHCIFNLYGDKNPTQIFRL